MIGRHYTHPKQFVGRSLIYLIYWNDTLLGATVGGSAALSCKSRDSYFNYAPLNNIVNNVFFHVEPPTDGYPLRNFTSVIVRAFRERAACDWLTEYGDAVIGFETFVEPPRTGELYRRDGWMLVGATRGIQLKSDHGRKRWDRTVLRPKLVFCRPVGTPKEPPPDMRIESGPLGKQRRTRSMFGR